MRRTALSMTVSNLMKERVMIARAFKRLCNLNALATLTLNLEFQSEVQFIDRIFWSPTIQKLSLLSLVTREEAA